VLLGLSLVQGDAEGTGRSLLALGGFLAGAGVGARIAYRGADAGGWPRGVTLALAIETAVLVALAGVTASVATRIALASVAMGVQSAAARRLDVFGITTTFITGTLTSLASLVARHGVLPSASGHGKRLLAAVWTVYVVGAMAAGLATRLDPDAALLVPAVVVAVAVLVALARFWRA
jgi:uncharacterized membrane protein YoaK (UPF0700 family)